MYHLAVKQRSMTQRVLVTAGASGIGREIARAFAARDAKVFVCDIDAKGLDNLAQEIPGLATKVCDVSKRADIEAMVTFGVNALGGLDVLVNNAGISGPTVPVEEMDPDAWEQVVQINLNGTFNVTRLAIPHLKKSSSGVIIIMSSVAGRFFASGRCNFRCRPACAASSRSDPSPSHLKLVCRAEARRIFPADESRGLLPTIRA